MMLLRCGMLLVVSLVAVAGNSDDSDPLTFFAIGDWGGTDEEPYYTEGQQRSASAMANMASQHNASFFLGLGDNFYYEGISTDPADATNPRFEQTFEAVYSAESLNRPWYLCPGNHDYKGNVSAEIAYTEMSAKWNMPHYFYHKTIKHDDIKLELIMIDTVQLSGLAEREEDEFKQLPLKARDHSLEASKQWDWLEKKLEEVAESADYILVGGHYPVYSACAHGSTQTLIEHLKPLLQKFEAHSLSGHDHCAEHIKEEDSPVNYILQGMGMECCYDLSNTALVPDGALLYHTDNKSDGAGKTIIGGFSMFSATKESMQVNYYDQDGNLLYAAAPIAARKKS